MSTRISSLRRSNMVPPNKLYRPAQSQNVTNLSPMQRPNAAYRSTSDFFKEMMTPVDPLSIKRTNSATNISSKKVEDYQEEQARLKRSVTALAHDNAVLRSHLQKAEREAAKKARQLEELLGKNPTGVSKLSAGSTSSIVIDSLQKRVCRLEQALKDRETAIRKLNSDIRVTEMNELRVQLAIFYKEIQRLHQLLGNNSIDKVNIPKDAPKSIAAKVARFNSQLSKLQQENSQLRRENERLSKSIRPAMRFDAEADANPDEMKDDIDEVKRLKDHIRELEQDLEASNGAKLRPESTSGDQKTMKIIAKLREERQQYKTQLELKSTEASKYKQRIKELEQTISKLEKSRSTRRITSAALANPDPESNGDLSKEFYPKAERKELKPTYDAEKVAKFRRNHAAKTIQKGWKGHKKRTADKDLEDAESLIVSAAKGHLARKNFLDQQAMIDTDDDDDAEEIGAEVDDSGIEETAAVIQSAGRAHLQRKKFIEEHAQSVKRNRLGSNDADVDDDDDDVRF